MAQKERLQRQLRAARQHSERLLEDFHTPEAWTHQVHPGCNHALWFAGHMAYADNFFISIVDPNRSVKLPEFEAKFGMGSQPTNSPADYPTAESVLESMRERRGTLLEILGQLSDEALAGKTPDGAPEFLPDLASVFEMAVWHEGMHSGQLSVVRRAMGKPPIVGAPA
ncbi:MAG: hypothetical protein RIS70_3176 [Planctomycetota bacterium]